MTGKSNGLNRLAKASGTQRGLFRPAPGATEIMQKATARAATLQQGCVTVSPSVANEQALKFCLHRFCVIPALPGQKLSISSDQQGAVAPAPAVVHHGSGSVESFRGRLRRDSASLFELRV